MSEHQPKNETTPDSTPIDKRVLPVDQTETSPQDPERTEHELQAHEALNKFQMFRTDIHEGAANFLTGTQRKIAETKNLLSTPKNVYLELRRDSAKRKYDRVAAKQDTSRFSFINNRRDRKAAKAYSKLQERRANFRGHNTLMRDRFNKVDNRNNERHKGVAEHRKELMEKRVRAMERKLIREERRARRESLADNWRLSHAERERKVRTFTKEDMKRIRKTAVESLKNIHTERNKTYATA